MILLNNNQIQHIAPSSFVNLPQLYVLLLRNNQIQYSPASQIVLNNVPMVNMRNAF